MVTPRLAVVLEGASGAWAIESWKQMRTLSEIARSRWAASVATGLGLAAFALAGCQGDVPKRVEGERGQDPRQGRTQKKQRPAATAPRAQGNIKEAARRFGAAVESNDCERVRSLGFFGQDQIDDAACSLLRQQLEGFAPIDSETYGTSAVVDYTAEQGQGTVVFLTGRDRRFKWALRFARQQGEEVVGTEPPEPNSLDATARAATRALRQGECDQLAQAGKGILPRPELPKQFCERAESLRRQLTKDPDARPERLGANSRVAFYSLLPKPSGPYLTLVLLQDGRRAALIQGFPVAAQRGN